MKQTLHIFKKDARRLRWEIALTLLLVALVPVNDGHPDSNLDGLTAVLLPFAWIFLTGRVIQGEALSGNRQFWLTRPYSRASLLGAKLLFLTVFVVLPMAISDAVIVKLNGFALSAYVPGLLWESVLRAMVFVAPAMIFAVISRDTKGQFGGALAAGVVLIAGMSLSFTSPTSWGILAWLRYSIVLTYAAAGAVAIILWQYARRRAVIARVATAALFAGGGLLFILPSSIGWSLASRFSSHWIEHSSLAVSLDPSIPPIPIALADPVEVQLPLRIDGVPEGLTTRANEVQVDVAPEGSYAAPMSFDHVSVGAVAGGFDGFITVTTGTWEVAWKADDRGVRQVIHMSRQTLDSMKDTPVRIHTLAVLTLTRRTSGATVIPNTASPAMVPSVGRCDARHLTCAAPFRPPGGVILTNWTNTQVSWASYSPFPAEVGVDPMSAAVLFLSHGPLPDVLTVSSEEPVEHLRQEFTLEHVHLKDFVAPRR